MLIVQKLQLELRYGLLKLLHHFGGLKCGEGRLVEESRSECAAIIFFYEQRLGRPWPQTERVPDSGGSCPSRAWLRASAHSARADLSPAPSPSAEPGICESRTKWLNIIKKKLISR